MPLIKTEIAKNFSSFVFDELQEKGSTEFCQVWQGQSDGYQVRLQWRSGRLYFSGSCVNQREAYEELKLILIDHDSDEHRPLCLNAVFELMDWQFASEVATGIKESNVLALIG